jgi:hypothetical protein
MFETDEELELGAKVSGEAMFILILGTEFDTQRKYHN